MKRAIHVLNKILYKIAGYFVSADLAGLCLLIDYSVIMRFVFNKPVSWQYELTLVGLCYAVFIGMPMAFHKDEHMRLTFVTNKLKPETWVIYMGIIDVLLIVFMAFGFYHSISIMQTTWKTYYKTIKIRKGVYYLAFTLGSAFSIVSLVDNILCRKKEDAPLLKLQKDGETA